MLKSVFVIEAKLSLEKTQEVKKYLESNAGFEKTDSCAHADYIVTELKSPSRIMRNAKKSTCPVVHVAWLLDSIRLGKQLDPHDYLIDVSDARKQLENDILSRITDKALPRQLTWDQVALRRLKKKNFEKSPHLARDAGLRERALFSRTYGNRYKSFKRTSLSRTSLSNLEEKKISPTIAFSTDTYLSSTGNRSYPTPIDRLEKDACLTTHHITQARRNVSSLLLNGGLRKKQTEFSDVCNDPRVTMPYKTGLDFPIRKPDDIFNNNTQDTGVLPTDIIIIKDDSFNKNDTPTKFDEIITIEDHINNKIVTGAANKNTKTDLIEEGDQDFSVVANKELSTSHDDIYSSNRGNIPCSPGKTFDDGANSSFEFNCSSISSIEFDMSPYSLSAILSL